MSHKVLAHVVKSGAAEWIDPKSRTNCIMWFKSSTQFANQIFAWATEYGHRNSVVTLDEITGKIYNLTQGC